VATVHEEVHQRAKQQENDEDTAARKDMRPVFVGEEEPDRRDEEHEHHSTPRSQEAASARLMLGISTVRFGLHDLILSSKAEGS
jgi:hypothetical protein